MTNIKNVGDFEDNDHRLKEVQKRLQQTVSSNHHQSAQQTFSAFVQCAIPVILFVRILHVRPI